MDMTKSSRQRKPPTKPRQHSSHQDTVGLPKFLRGKNPKTLWETYSILFREDSDAEEIRWGNKAEGPG